MTTTQAQEVRDALRSIGLRSRRTRVSGIADFHVRTQGSGSSPNGFGDAVALIYTAAARQAVIDNADELAARYGVQIDLYHRDGAVVYVGVFSGSGRVMRVDLDTRDRIAEEGSR